MDELQAKSASLPSIAKALANGQTVQDYCTSVFADYGIQNLASEPVAFSCPCNRDNFATFLSRLPLEEKKAILQAGKFPLELQLRHYIRLRRRGSEAHLRFHRKVNPREVNPKKQHRRHI